MEAGSLGIGTSIVSRAGPALSVTDLTWEKNKAQELAAGSPGSSFGGYTVYNLTVADDHTFFVGTANGGTWVHNNACESLTRYAGGKESATRLGRLAQESLENAEEMIHGISTTAGEVNPERASSTLARDVVEQNFPVHDTPTGADPLHRTVELPNPVTPEVAKAWNQMWGFK